jgi:hypothetical protein
MFIQTLLIATGTLVAVTAIIWSIMPIRHLESFGV